MGTNTIDSLSGGPDSAPQTEQSETHGNDEDATNTEPDNESLPLDAVFDILRNERRRRVLRYLLDNDGRATISTLAEHIAAIENDTTTQALSAQERKRVYVGLYQCHLPRMDDTGVVHFEQGRGVIELADAADQLCTYLDRDDGDGDGGAQSETDETGEVESEEAAVEAESTSLDQPIPAEASLDITPYYVLTAGLGGVAYFGLGAGASSPWLPNAIVTVTIVVIIYLAVLDRSMHTD
ncbi:DUF7344 domain-containing protein [Haloarchaeobius sp. DFWS5]|uniref:DUF7344 domain-containing protein n=1 Tax=Haloarchaeobius sp. DFWS5 TaxID=3446114 RepID=UPI003EBDEB27